MNDVKKMEKFVEHFTEQMNLLMDEADDLQLYLVSTILSINTIMIFEDPLIQQAFITYVQQFISQVAPEKNLENKMLN